MLFQIEVNDPRDGFGRIVGRARTAEGIKRAIKNDRSGMEIGPTDAYVHGYRFLSVRTGKRIFDVADRTGQTGYHGSQE